MLTISLHAPEYENSISPACPIGSGQEYIVCITVEDELLNPQQDVEVTISVKINGETFLQNLKEITNEDGQIKISFDVSPEADGLLEVKSTVKDNYGLTWRATEKWNINISSDYRDCFEY